MDLRDVIVWLGLVAICLIVWDGMRRMKAAKPKVTRKEPTTSEDDYIDPEEAKKKAEIARELPNGGARTREMTETEKKAIKTRLNLRERVPMLMERVEVEVPDDNEDSSLNMDSSVLQSEMDFSLALAEPEMEAETAKDTVPEKDKQADTPKPLYSEHDAEMVDDQPNDLGDDSESEDPAPEADPAETISDDKIDDEDELDRDVETEMEPSIASDESFEDTMPVKEASNNQAVDPGPVEDIVVIHVMAKKGEVLSGSSVLDLLITAGLRHGPMDIFHYRNPKGITEFSLANCVHPGTFDPDSMNQVNTPGVTLFMQLPTAADSMESFDHMYEMARFLANHIDAEILDEDHSTVTPQRIEYYREKLRSFERARLIPS
jgi:cell division protein ZipA